MTNGLFSVLLGDTTLTGMTQTLTATVFSGTDRTLRVWFAQAGSGPFIRLTPDRRIAAVPYALQADEAKDAGTLDGIPASAFQRHYQNVVVVAKSGGDYISIQAALDSITDASYGNRYLVWVAPGTYSERVTMKRYVDIEGAGELVTEIAFTGSDESNTGTVVGVDNAELRALTVRSMGGGMYNAVAIYDNAASPRLTGVTAVAAGGRNGNCGVYNNSSSPTMTGVTASATGGGYGPTYNWGVYNNSSSPTMTGVTASAAGGAGSFNYGVANYSSSSPTMTDIAASATGGIGSNDYGVANYNSSSPTMTGVTALASGNTGSYNYGVYNNSSSPTIQNSTLRATSGSHAYGLFNAATDARSTTAR